MVKLGAALLLGAVLMLGLVLVHTADDAQCSSTGAVAADDADVEGCGSSGGWRENATHATTACNMPVLDAGAGGLSLGELVQRLSAATTPLLIRGLLDLEPGWHEQGVALGNRAALLEEFGGEQMELSVGTLLSNGPESTKLDHKKVSFMQENWASVAEALGDDVAQQIADGEPRPRVQLRDWVRAMREGSTPEDSYVFFNISRGRVAQALTPLHALWRDLIARHDPSLTRLGVGGPGSGAPFHDHDVLALNVAFAGRKRWLVTRPCRPACRIPFYQGGAAVYHPQRILREAGLAASALQQLAEGGDTWDCVQHAGEVVFVPKMFLHSTINLDESVAVAVQCDGVDVRAGMSELNALIVIASGAAGELGPCGTAWESPFGEDVGASKALDMLERLPDSFRGDPTIFLNRPMRDGHVPADVAVRYGSAEVASALAAHGARF